MDRATDYESVGRGFDSLRAYFITNKYGLSCIPLALMTDILNGRKRRPTHPGELIREELLPQFRISQGELADAIAVSRRTVNEVLTALRTLREPA